METTHIDPTPCGADEPADERVDFSQAFYMSEELSPEMVTRIRKNQAVVLQKIDAITGTALAEKLGVHESAVSRFKTKGGLAFTARLLAALDLKVVPADAIVFIQPDQYN